VCVCARFSDLDELKMSRAQRREAMNIPVNLQFRSSAGEEACLYELSPHFIKVSVVNCFLCALWLVL